MDPRLGIGEVPTERFLTEFWSVRPLLATRAHQILLGPEKVYDSFLANAPSDRTFRCFHPSRTERSQGRTDLLALWEEGPPELSRLVALNTTHMLLLRAAQRRFPVLASVRELWQETFSCNVSTNLYLTKSSRSAFPAHHDGHHVVVLQMSGEKEWHLWPPLVRSPMRRFSWQFAQPSEPPLRFHTVAGDALYIPLGWVHCAQTHGPVSVHATIGIDPPRWIDLVRDEIDSLGAEHSILRAPLPAEYSDGKVTYSHEGAGDLLRWVWSGLTSRLLKRS